MLGKVVQELCQAAGLPSGGFRSNHSLRASAATRLYNCCVDEQLIKETTGHSSDAVRSYKRTSDDMLKTANYIVQGQSRSADKPESVKTPVREPVENHQANHGISVTVNIRIP